MKLARFLLKRLCFTIITLLVLSFLIFYTTSFFPPLQRVFLYISPFSYSHPGHDVYSKLPQIAEKYGLYDPFYVQYVNWLKVTSTEFTLGYSELYNDWVSAIILDRFPVTLELVIFSAPLIIIGGIKLGVYSARRAHEKKGREDIIDLIVRVITVWAYSLPIFFIGILMLSIFFLNLHLVFPGRLGTEAQQFLNINAWNSYTGILTIDALLNGQYWIFFDALKQLVLPVATLTISTLPIVSRVTRSSMLIELSKPYVIMARAKGIREKEVISHARKNAMIPILTISSTIFASMLTGIIVTEHTFGFYGIGALAVEAANRLDFPLLTGLSLFFCLLFVVINLLVDIIYTYIDPRVNL